MAKKIRAKLTLSQREDGMVVIEILTSSRLGPFENYNHRIQPPEEYLTKSGAFGMMAVMADGHSWRYLTVCAHALGAGNVVDRHFDLSVGSKERALIELMIEQPEIPVVWVNEGVQVLYPFPRQRASDWREALENTRGISAKAWGDEIEERIWQQSESWRPGVPRPRRYRPRTATAPDGPPLPFFARRSGAIPKTGAPEVAGVRLPAGARQPPRPAAYWASDEPVAQIATLAPYLASVFDQTGLWPLLWRLDEDPHNYMYGQADIDAIDAIDLTATLAERWEQRKSGLASTAPFAAFPGLAPAQSGPERVDVFPARAFERPARLLLVPCNRPADAVTALGGIDGDSDPPVVSAILRSWEQRAGAVLYEVEPGTVRLSIARPPGHVQDALRFAVELYALGSLHDPAPTDIHGIAEAILAGEQPASDPAAPAPARRDDRGVIRTNWDILC